MCVFSGQMARKVSQINELQLINWQSLDRSRSHLIVTKNINWVKLSAEIPADQPEWPRRSAPTTLVWRPVDRLCSAPPRSPIGRAYVYFGQDSIIWIGTHRIGITI